MVYNVREERLCLFCGRVLSGRSDKKYCDDNCRNNYHYQSRKDNNEEIVKSVNNSLLYNRDVLAALNRRRKKVVKKQHLKDHRFNFEMMTAIYRTRKGTEYRVIYDHAYRFLNEEDVLLLRL